MTVLYLTLCTIAFLWAFWGCYVLVMGLYRAKLDGRLTPLTYAMSLPFLLIGLVMDVLANLTLASVVFLEPPREWLVTDRLQRHIATRRFTWRYKLAAWVCTHLLDFVDPTGAHCD